MKSINQLLLAVLTLVGVMTSTLAQEVSIPDPGLNAVIREVLNRPVGPLTEQDLLGLIELDASGRSINSLQGLEAAHNLVTLSLQSNQLANLTFPGGLGNLYNLDLSFNPLTNCAFPSGLTNLTTLIIEGSGLSGLTLRDDMRGLNALFLEGNRLTSFHLPTNLSSLGYLSLAQNRFTNLTLSAGLPALTVLDLWGNGLSCVTLPDGMTNLLSLSLFFNQLTNLTLPNDLVSLGALDLDDNRLTSLTLSSNLTRLSVLRVRNNQLTDLNLPATMTRLRFLDAEGNQLRSFTLPAGSTNLDFLRLSGNQLASFTLPSGLTNLTVVFLRSNQLTNLTLSAGLVNLVQIDVFGNQLATLTLPLEATNLSTLVLAGNPLTSLVLSEPMATTKLAAIAASLRSQGVAVFTYPLAVRLAQPGSSVGAFQFEITGPPGIYTVLGSTNLAVWNALTVATNALGAINVADASASLASQKFYRAVGLNPTNMVFVPPNTFTMGSPANDPDRSVDESPQTRVTLTRGFWIAKYEVTQGEYLEVMGENPSNFPGDLSRPICSVNWLDATNYCAKLTQREQAAGRIPVGSQYRLPTEAEWESAARAGTSTRFSYGDDPSYASVTNYAWFLDLANPDLTVHPVGQKLPNPWGLFDVHGNVWEWCQDNYGALPGGIQVDPTGPTSTLLRDKVIRGGAYDYPNSSCRSAARLFRFPLWPDSDVGFRVVFVTGP